MHASVVVPALVPAVGAISEDNGKYKVDEASCIDCDACTGACPVGAIAAE